MNLRDLMRHEKLRRKQEAEERASSRISSSCEKTTSPSVEHRSHKSNNSDDKGEDEHHLNYCCVQNDNKKVQQIRKDNFSPQTNIDHKVKRVRVNESLAVIENIQNDVEFDKKKNLPADFFDSMDVIEDSNMESENLTVTENGPKLETDPDWISKAWGDEKVTMKEEYFIYDEDTSEISEIESCQPSIVSSPPIEDLIEPYSKHNELQDAINDDNDEVLSLLTPNCTNSYLENSLYNASDSIQFNEYQHEELDSGNKPKLILPDDFFTDSDNPGNNTLSNRTLSIYKSSICLAAKHKMTTREQKIETALKIFHQEVDAIQQKQDSIQYKKELSSHMDTQHEIEAETETFHKIVDDIKKKKIEKFTSSVGTDILPSSLILPIAEDNDDADDIECDINDTLNYALDAAWRCKTLK